MPTVGGHFSGRSTHVLEIYRKIFDVSSTLALILTLKTDRDIKHHRVHKTEQTSANRWRFEVRLNDPAEVDAQIPKWLHASYELAQ